MNTSSLFGIEDENVWSYTFTPPIYIHNVDRENYQSWRMVRHNYSHLLYVLWQTYQEERRHDRQPYNRIQFNWQ
jgi:hypothetical protein